MRLKKIKNKNFCSFEDAELELLQNSSDKNAIYLIHGINKDITDDSPEETSNGSGKSTIIGESVTFNLFNRPLRGDKKKSKIDQLIKRQDITNTVKGKSKGSVLFNEVEYFVNDDILTITKTKKKDSTSASTEVKLNGEDKSKRLRSLTNDDIIEFIGIPYDVFSQTIASYADNGNFIDMNFTQRIDLFKKIINIEFMDDIYDKIDKSNKKFIEKIRDIEWNIDRKKELISLMNKNKDDMKKYVEDKIEDLKKELKQNDNRKKELKDVKEYENKIEEIDEKIEKVKESINSINNIINTNNKEITNINNKITKITKLRETTCSQCGQVVSGDYVDTQVQELKNQLDIYEKSNKVANDQLKMLNDGTIEKYQADKKNVQNIINEMQRLSISISSVEQRIKNEIKAKEKELQNINPVDTIGITNAEEEVVELGNEKDKLDYLMKYSKPMKDLFSPKSVMRSAIYNKYVALVSDLFSHYISRLYNNELLSYVTINDDGEIDIVIIKNDQEISYWTLSSGEKARFTLAMFLALFNFVQCVANNPPSFLILDEPFEHMDIQGHKLAVQVINEIYSEMGVDIFIISHTDVPIEEFSEDVVIKRIKVVKENDISVAKII